MRGAVVVAAARAALSVVAAAIVARRVLSARAVTAADGAAATFAERTLRQASAAPAMTTAPPSSSIPRRRRAGSIALGVTSVVAMDARSKPTVGRLRGVPRLAPAGVAMAAFRECAPDSASRTSAAEPYRSSGVRASSFSTTRSSESGSPGSRRRTLGGCSASRRLIICSRVGATKGGVAVSMRYRMQPSAYRSLRMSIGSPSSCSGLMNSGVPMTRPVRVSASPALSWTALAMPKSTTLATSRPSDFRVTRMLSGLRSRWMICSSCAAPRPSAIWRAISSERSTVIGASRARMRDSGSPSTYSITR